MMIHNSKPLSMLSALENAGAITSGLQADGGNIEAFTSKLMQQLALLQGNSAGNATVDASVLADLQANAGAIDGHAATQDMQGFAALFGNTLPMQKKVDADIDLDETLNALADVLQHLQSIEADSAMAQLGTGGAPVVKDGAGDRSSQEQQAADQAAIAAAMFAVQTQPEAPQPGSIEANVDAGNPSNLIAEGLGLAAKKNTTLGNAAGNRDVLAAAPIGNDKPAQTGIGETAGALLNQDHASGGAGQDKQNAASDLATLADSSRAVEAEKTVTRMAADIAQMNKAVGADKKVEVPAMNRPLGHPEWNQELGEKLIWMHKQAVPSAELRINPQHLGPISIKVDVHQDQTTISFTAQHAGVKEAIETALPKLREMLSEQQLNLVDVNVSQQQSGQRQPSDFFKMASDRGPGGTGQPFESEDGASAAAVDIVDEIEAGRALASNGLLSLFA